MREPARSASARNVSAGSRGAVHAVTKRSQRATIRSRSRSSTRASLQSPCGLRDPRDPRRAGAGPRDRRDHHADLPDVDVRPGRGRRAQGLRLLARREPHTARPPGGSRLARVSRARRRLLLRARRDDDPLPSPEPRRPGRPDRRRLRRRLPDDVSGLRAEGLPVRLPAGRGVPQPRRPPRRLDADGVDRDAVEPPAQHRRHPRRGRGRARGGSAPRRRQHVRDPVPAATARARRRRRRPLDDEVPRRSLRRRRRLRCDERPDGGRAPALPPEVARRRARPVRLLARAARDQDARAADAAALPERDGGGGGARAPLARRARLLPRPADAPRPRDRSAPDARLRRHGLVPRGVAGGGRGDRRPDTALPARGVARRRREPDRGAGADDARGDGRRAVRGAAEPRPPLGGNRVGRGPRGRPRERARRGGCALSLMSGEAVVFVEIPSGSRNNYEWDDELGGIVLDRRLFTAMTYPADYGYVEGTLAEDGDPLDALVLVSDPTFPGCRIRVRTIGVFHMEDEKGPDEKLLSVPLGDPAFERIRDIHDVANELRDEIEHFFQRYKDLEPSKRTETRGWGNRDEAERILSAARDRQAG